jgi:hypothetical protein
MFRPLADARYWFRSAAEEARRPSAKPTPYTPYGAVVFADGTTVELDYTDRDDERKLSGLEVAQVVGIGWRDRFTGEWRVTVRGDIHTKHEAKGATLADALRAALDVCYTTEAAEIALRDDAPAHLERELRCHDWWHMLSDSYGATVAGQRHMAEIMGIVARVPSATVRTLWAAHAPADFACPV